MTDTTDEHIHVYKIRPRFRTHSELHSDEIVNRIKAGLDDPTNGYWGKRRGRHIVLGIPPEEQHFWSPQLSLTIEEEESGSYIRGLYGPKPSVWTMFAFFYALLIFGIIILGVFDISYRMLDKPTSFVPMILTLCAALIGLYVFAYFGKRLGRDQMRELHHFIENVIGHEV